MRTDLASRVHYMASRSGPFIIVFSEYGTRKPRTLMRVVDDSRRMVTRRERSLHEMDAVIPWARWKR